MLIKQITVVIESYLRVLIEKGFNSCSGPCCILKLFLQIKKKNIQTHHLKCFMKRQYIPHSDGKHIRLIPVQQIKKKTIQKELGLYFYGYMHCVLQLYRL